MKYSSEYLLQVAQKSKTIPPMGPQTPFEALSAILRAGLQLKRNSSGEGLLVVDAKGVVQGWPNLPQGMESLLGIIFLVVHRDEAQLTEFWCPGNMEKEQLLNLGFPLENVWTKEALAQRTNNTFFDVTEVANCERNK